MSDLNLNVAMIGPRGCGKTSVLSIMLGELENFINKLNGDPDVRKHCAPKVDAAAFCIETLKSSYESLKSIATNDVLEKGVNVLWSTDSHIVYNIDLSVSGISSTISFHDFPGAYFLPENHKNVDLKELQACSDVFDKADVIILCVDVPSQITHSTPCMKAMNESYAKYITEFIKIKSSIPSANNLIKEVIVLPIKCEGAILDTNTDEYTGYKQSINPEKNKGLYNDIKNLYKDLFTYLEKSDTPANSFYLPVITMGCVKAEGLEYDAESGKTHISFQPVVNRKYTQLRYYQCNSSSLLALCLWTAEAIITQKYISSASFFARVKVLFGGVWPTQWFRDKLFEECSLHKILWDYVKSQPDYENLSDEAKKNYEELESMAKNQPFTGCRLI